jgi:hypothetical protein
LNKFQTLIPFFPSDVEKTLVKPISSKALPKDKSPPSKPTSKSVGCQTDPVDVEPPPVLVVENVTYMDIDPIEYHKEDVVESRKRCWHDAFSEEYDTPPKKRRKVYGVGPATWWTRAYLFNPNNLNSH